MPIDRGEEGSDMWHRLSMRALFGHIQRYT